MTTNKKPLAQSIAVIALSTMALDTAYAAIEEVTVTAQRRAKHSGCAAGHHRTLRRGTSGETD